MVIETIQKAITDAISNNQFLSGGLVLGIIGGIAVYLRGIPASIIELIRRKVIVDIEIRSTEECYLWLLRWFHTQKFIEKSNKLIVSEWEDANEYSYGDKANRHHYCFSPGIGSHLLKYDKRFFWLRRDRDDGGANKDGMFMDRETIHISTFKWNKSTVFEIIDNAKINYFGNSESGVPLYTPRYSDWGFLRKIGRRPVDSVILNNGTMGNIINDISMFISSRERYVELGIPYHRGYMFSGPPGTGKTATITALASHFGRPIFYLNLSSLSSDCNMSALFSGIPSGVFLVIEDIDTASVAYRPDGNNETQSSFKVTFGNLLNSLDGIVAQDGLCVFVTTNHPERLDEALVRKGRIDLHIEFGYADHDMTARMIRRFLDDADECMVSDLAEEVGRAGNISMASLQEALNGAKTVFDVRCGLGLSAHTNKAAVNQ